MSPDPKPYRPLDPGPADPVQWMMIERLRQRGLAIEVLDETNKAVVSAVLSAVDDLASAVSSDPIGKSALAAVLHVLADVLDVDCGFVVICPVCSAAVPGLLLAGDDGRVTVGGHFEPNADVQPEPAPCAGIGRAPLHVPT